MQNQPDTEQPYLGQPEPASRKSSFDRHKVLTVFLTSLALIVVVSVVVPTLGGSDTPAGTADAAGTAGTGDAPAPDETVPGLGSAVRDGKLEFTVTALEPGVTRVGDEILGADPQGQFVLVHVSVTNIGDAAQMFDASAQKMLDTQGREHSADPTAGIYLGDANSFLDDIDPGSSTQGVVVFDVPAGAVPAGVELHDSFMSGGATVTLG
ncbi:MULTISPECIES: DUF4352 domain-containing protein [Oerskovia]|uniref:DUF4352 domain-containing protein n=1 Tax=Oerskovia rustica TaxID=2762237 RepID=A0ABR8RMX6_9CELL|nr:DUF4352 domain-containing protein [Oerskovia rustica]MBD7949143.1 DUF4352 domain-containing protein [Oerskovia rustica]